jgi:hypothetical protein
VTRLHCLDAVRRDEFLQSSSQNFEEKKSLLPSCMRARFAPAE